MVICMNALLKTFLYFILPKIPRMNMSVCHMSRLCIMLLSQHRAGHILCAVPAWGARAPGSWCIPLPLHYAVFPKSKCLR